MIELFPSLICADLLNLAAVLAHMDPYVTGYHIDVMDFHFVPNLTWGPDSINAIAQKTTKPLMVHLMVHKPEQYLDRLHLRKNDYIVVHPESPSSISFSELLKEITYRGYVPSIALNPETDPTILASLTGEAQHTVLMAVQPGFSGQKLLPLIYDKITKVRSFTLNQPYTIAIDGGVTLENRAQLILLGAQQLIVGSAIFGSQDPVKTAQTFLQPL